MQEYPGRAFHNIPLAVERRKDNPDFVTWSSAATVLGEWNDKFTLLTETRVTSVGRFAPGPGQHIDYALVRDLGTNQDRLITAKVNSFPVDCLPLTHCADICSCLRVAAYSTDPFQ